MITAKYFTATWCGPCKAFKPIMQELQSEGYNIQFVDVDQDSQLAEQYGVRSVPTVIVESNGQVLTRVLGIQTKEYMKNIL